MSLTAGSRFGSYEVQALLGVGGMGEVYRARDTQLKRDVALKVLPADVSRDADRLARFQREAEILASLNHSNIAQIYGLGDADGVRALVMELVDGPTLADRVARGALPLDESLGIAKQIAEALEAAHDRGIVHRDLKPANVKVTGDGVVKVLDFGLAKALDAGVGGEESSPGAATITSPALMRVGAGFTSVGVILGTAAYMSPEQARGRAVDARTDVWAFGCVVFEMLTGRGPFDGETVTDVLGAIVHKEPAWTTLPAETPERLRRLLQRCLTKDQKQRLRNIADARMEIEDLIVARRSGTSDAERSAPRDRGGRLSARDLIVLTAGLAIGAAVVAVAWMNRSPASSAVSANTPSMRVSILHDAGTEVGVPAISPNGRRVAYRARREDGTPFIWVRDLDQPAPRPLAGTEDGRQPFWSPDSKNVGFVVGNVLKRMPADGGPIQEIAHPVQYGATWGTDDVILYAPPDNAIHRVSANGGAATAVTKLPGKDWGHLWPAFLPDGRHFLYTAKMWTGLAESSQQGVYLGSLDGATTGARLLPDLTNAVYAAPGYLVFARDGKAMAAAFDARSGRITGDAVPLGESVADDRVSFVAGLSAGSDGTLALRPRPAPSIVATAGSGAFDAELRVLTRNGDAVATVSGTQLFIGAMALSPDGGMLASAVHDAPTATDDIWRFDIRSGTRVAMTSTRSNGGWVGSPVWSPDGTRVAYACQSSGIMDDVCVQDVRTGAVSRIIQSATFWEHPSAWSADGQHMLVLFDERIATSLTELRVWSAQSRTLTPYVKASGNVSDSVFSPDMRYVAYSSAETGRWETYVTTFPERRQTWSLTTDGAKVLSWRRDGKEILVGTMTGHIVAYAVDTSSGFTAGAPQTLIRNVGFDVIFARPTADHSRIIVRVPKDVEKDKGEIRLLFGWQKGLQGTSAR